MGEEAESSLDQAYDDWGAMRGPQPKLGIVQIVEAELALDRAYGPQPKMTTGKCVGDYYRRFNNGDTFSDVQLRDAVMKMCRLKEDLRSLGDPFHLQYREIKRVLDGLEEYLTARIVRDDD